jgi:hypothetical protein
MLLAPPKKQYINFSDATIHSVRLNLHKKTAIKMTTSHKFKYKTKRDLMASITA